MAISTFMGLETSLRGLLAQQQALDVTSHNIANASTTGYSRQTAVLVASPWASTIWSRRRLDSSWRSRCSTSPFTVRRPFRSPPSRSRR